MAHRGNVQLTSIVIVRPEHVAEGDRLFATHAAWMEATHHRTGDKALLSYNVSKGPELSDPMNPDSAPTGNTCYILTEIYETGAGPFNPPPELVVVGPYAWMRNPMLTGVFAFLFGVGFLLHSVSMVFVWTPLFLVLNAIELKLVEEPELELRFGASYRDYRQRVPMFIPRAPGRSTGVQPNRPYSRRAARGNGCTAGLF